MKKIILLICLFFFVFLISCGKEYHIEYDLDGGFLEEMPSSFKKTNDFSLPIPTKEGYFFVGWIEEGNIINKLEKKNYSLKALWSTNCDYTYINDEDIFIQNELVYYVYLMRDGCSWCESIKDNIVRYQEISLINKNIKKLYVINLQTNGKSSKILRTYEDDEEGFFVNGVDKWNDLYIPSTPTLIEIKEQDGKKTAELLEIGATAIKNKLFDSLCDSNDYSQTIDVYSISYDLDGGMCDNLITEFNKYIKVLLPLPTKEGFYFGGWVEENDYIREIENKSYNLTAIWLDETKLETLAENDIFSKNDSYYIYFLKYSDDNNEMIERIKKYNALATSYNLPLIYLVDLENCDVIYRSSESGTYQVDGAKSIEEMYVSRKKSLILIENNVAIYICDTPKQVTEYLEGLINVNLVD